MESWAMMLGAFPTNPLFPGHSWFFLDYGSIRFLSNVFCWGFWRKSTSLPWGTSLRLFVSRDSLLCTEQLPRGARWSVIPIDPASGQTSWGQKFTRKGWRAISPLNPLAGRCLSQPEEEKNHLPSHQVCFRSFLRKMKTAERKWLW